MPELRYAGVFAAAALMFTTPPLEAQTGVVRGRATDESGRGVAYVTVSLVGTDRSVRAGRDGRYELAAVPAGDATIRVTAIGYAAQTHTVSVSTAAVTRLDVTLQRVAIDLDAIVVTATGDARAVEVPHAIATIDAERVAEEVAPIDLASVIQGRAPGVQVLSQSGTAGTGTKILVRGASSLSLNNEPILIVDGIRVDSRPASWLDLPVGGQGISRYNDLNPDEIESIDVVKGPSAAALYGTDAANGVIVVTTKRGRAGPPVFNVYGEMGTVADRNVFPDNYRGVAQDGSTCAIAEVAAGTCQQAGLEQANPLMSRTTTPITTGGRYQLGGNVAGGTGDVQYFLAAEYQQEDGVYTLPTRTQDSILAARPAGYEIPDFVLNPNQVSRVSLRGNLSAQLTRTMNVQVSTGYIDGAIRLPSNDNNSLGLMASGLFGLSDSTDRGGWGIFAPEEVFWVESVQNIQRFTQSASVTLAPVTWLDLRLVGGVDYSGTSNVSFQPPGAGPDWLDWQDGGWRRSEKLSSWDYTLDVRGTARVPLTNRLISRSSIGVQYFRTYRQGVLTRGTQLPPGAGSNASATDQRIDESFFENRTLGTYVEQQVGYDGRLFVTGALRGDDNSAFGREFDYTVYPKIGASYVLLDRGDGMLNNMRLRAAWGASGVQPGPSDAVLYYTGVPYATPSGDSTGVVIANAGNTDLRPERSQEWEAGVDASVLARRLGFTFTYYRRATTDALVWRPLPPSLGLTSGRFENLGKTLNYGIEVGVNGALPLTRSLRWSFNVAGSTNTNRIVALGEGVTPILLDWGYQAHKEGYPLGAYWDYPYTYEDRDGNGLITADEITVGDTTEFVGYARPRYELAVFNAIEIGSWLRISGLFDYRGGHLHENRTEGFRCVIGVCQELNDVRTPLDGQARAAAYALATRQTSAGYLEPGWFIKLRELSLTFFAPQGLARMVGADQASLTITGRNLLTITDYSGMDPEIDWRTDDFVAAEFLTQPPVRYWSARLHLTF